MKVVIDTSVWISSLVSSNGNSRQIIRLALQEKISPQMGVALFCEYEDIMRRKAIQEKTPLSSIDLEKFFAAFLSCCTWCDIYFLWRPNITDEGDNHIVELAVASGSKYVITHNISDFKNCELRFDIQFTTPDQFLRSL